MRNSNFTYQDKIILENLIPLIEGISSVCGPNYEVTLHSLEDTKQSVIAIENGFITGRKVGSGMVPLVKDPLNELDENFESKDFENDVLGLFYTNSPNDHPLKGTAILIRNPDKIVIGVIEILVDVAIPMHEFVKSFLPNVNSGMMEEFSEHMPTDVDELIYSAIAEATSNAYSLVEISGLMRNRMIVRELNDRGIFNIRGAVEIVAKQLGISRYTVYNYLRDIK